MRTETHRRSLAKALSWRVIAWTITTALSYWVLGDARTAASIGLADSAVKLIAYYLHERAWIRAPLHPWRAGPCVPLEQPHA